MPAVSQASGAGLVILMLLLFVACRSPAPEEKPDTGLILHSKLDPSARKLAEATLQQTLENLPSDATGRWQVDGASVSGSVTPLRSFRIKTGHYCREFRETVARVDKIAARIEIACRKPKGGWVVVPPQDRRN